MRERIANWLRQRIDRWSPPHDAPVAGHVVVIGREGERAVFRMAGPVSVSWHAENELLPLSPLQRLLRPDATPSPRRTGVVVRLGDRIADAPAWLRERMAS